MINTLYIAAGLIVFVCFGLIGMESLSRIIDYLEQVIDRQEKQINQGQLIIQELRRIDADDLEGLEIMDLSHSK